MPNISIITTTYQHADFIAQTIESVLGQTYSDWEMLIGDDSPDNATWDVIQWYVAKYPTKIKARHHSPNKGIVDNMNFLIQQCDSQSDFIAFLEWDDRYTADNLMEKIKIFEKYPEVQLVYSDLSFIDKDNTVILQSFFNWRRIPYYHNTTITTDQFVWAGAWPIASRSTAMVRKAMIQHYPIRSLVPENKTYSVADYDLYFQIATQHPIYGITQPLTQYRRHAHNLSGASGWTSGDLEILVRYYHDQWLIDNNTYTQKMSRLSIVYAIFAIEHRDRHAWRTHLVGAWKHHPSAFRVWKIGIIWLLCMPISRSSVILQRLIKRW